MPRTEPRPNLIADALLTTLQSINAERDPQSWMTTPRTFARGFMGASLDSPRPVVLVQVGQVADTPQMSPGAHEATIQLLVHLITDMNEKADVTLNRLIADVYVAAAENENLATVDAPNGLVTWIFPRGHAPHPEAMEQSGFAVATVLFEALYQWTHGSP